MYSILIIWFENWGLFSSESADSILTFFTIEGFGNPEDVYSKSMFFNLFMLCLALYYEISSLFSYMSAPVHLTEYIEQKYNHNM